MSPDTLKFLQDEKELKACLDKDALKAFNNMPRHMQQDLVMAYLTDRNEIKSCDDLIAAWLEWNGMPSMERHALYYLFRDTVAHTKPLNLGA